MNIKISFLADIGSLYFIFSASTRDKIFVRKMLVDFDGFLVHFLTFVDDFHIFEF